MKIDCRKVEHGSREYGQTIALRRHVLRDPLGLQFSPEELAAEKDSFHLTGWSNGSLLACVVLSPLSGTLIRMRQFVVADTFQRMGNGRTLVNYLEEFVREQGFREIVLHARENAVEFYEKLGYAIEGERFIEVSLPHRTMRKYLTRG